MGFLIPSSPKIMAPPAPPPMAAPATLASGGATNAAAQTRQRAAAAAMASGQNPTSGQGIATPPSTAGLTLLGGTK